MAGPSYFNQLKTYISGAESRAGEPLSLANPNDPTQVVEISMQSLPERASNWPVGLPEPIMLENANAAGIAFITADDGEKYLLLRDRETGQAIAMSHEDIATMRAELAKPILDEIRADARGYDPYRDEFLATKNVYSPDLVSVEGGPQDGQVLRQAVLGADGTIERFGGNHIGAEIVLVDPSLREGDTPENPVTAASVLAGGGALNDVLIQGKGEMENAVLLDQIQAYGTLLNAAVDRDMSTGVNFGVQIPIAEITEGGVFEIRTFEAPTVTAPVAEVEPEAVADGVVLGARGEVIDNPPEQPRGVVVEGPEIDLPVGPQDVEPEPVEGFVLANELDGIAGGELSAIESGGFYMDGKGLRVLENIRRAMGTPLDPENVADYFDGRDEYKQIEEAWKPIAAQYVKDSVEAGMALPLGKDSPYRQSIEALEQGRIEDAQILLAGGEVAPQVEAVVTPLEVEPEEQYNPGRVDPSADYSEFERMADIEPAAGDEAEVEPDEEALRNKVESTTAQVEGLLAVAGTDENSPVYEITMALQVKAAISAVRSNFADAVAENGTIDVSKLPVNSDFDADYAADDQLRVLAERLNTLNEQYGSVDVEQRVRDMDTHSPGP